MTAALVVIRDLIGLVAFAAMIYGIWLLNQPAAWIVGGALVLLGVVAISRHG
jgi:hypothetical protein